MTLMLLTKGKYSELRYMSLRSRLGLGLRASCTRTLTGVFGVRSQNLLPLESNTLTIASFPPSDYADNNLFYKHTLQLYKTNVDIYPMRPFLFVLDTTQPSLTDSWNSSTTSPVINDVKRYKEICDDVSQAE